MIQLVLNPFQLVLFTATGIKLNPTGIIIAATGIIIAATGIKIDFQSFPAKNRYGFINIPDNPSYTRHNNK